MSTFPSSSSSNSSCENRYPLTSSRLSEDGEGHDSLIHLLSMGYRHSRRSMSQHSIDDKRSLDDTTKVFDVTSNFRNDITPRRNHNNHRSIGRRLDMVNILDSALNIMDDFALEQQHERSTSNVTGIDNIDNASQWSFSIIIIVIHTCTHLQRIRFMRRDHSVIMIWCTVRKRLFIVTLMHICASRYRT